jgi:hypothetical protein
MSDVLNVFLSSTLCDLISARKEITKFISILKSDVIAMEIFGSDETIPLDYCLQQVRRCNIFVGIYAARYGTVENTTGKSITEIEYLEAVKMLISKKLKGLLLYVLDQKSKWPLEFVEQNPDSLRKLAEFKKKIGDAHTLTFFNDEKELPYLVLSDIIRKIGIGPKSILKPKISTRINERKCNAQNYYRDILSSYNKQCIQPRCPKPRKSDRKRQHYNRDMPISYSMACMSRSCSRRPKRNAAYGSCPGALSCR